MLRSFISGNQQKMVFNSNADDVDSQFNKLLLKQPADLRPTFEYNFY